MHSSELYSHPDRLLEEHLIGVANLAKLFFEDKLLTDYEILKKIIKITALSHDLGKATSFFQDYLFQPDENKKRFLKNKTKTRHSLLSAVCAYYLTKESLINTNGYNDYYPFFAFEIVKRHHGNLQDLMDEAIFDDKDCNLVKKQLESINVAKFNILAKHLFKAGLPIILKKEIISKWLREFEKELKFYKRLLRRNKGKNLNYLILNLLYSILIDADKSDVVVQKSSCFERKTNVSLSQIVDIFKSKQTYKKTTINDLRGSAYKTVINNDINLNKRLYSINLPTGLGKTLTSFSFALKLREKIKDKTKNKCIPRIIYALPFLSIIDQNATVFEKVLRSSSIDSYSDIFLKHHHLSEIYYKKNRYEEFESDSAKIMIEGWNSEIIITTFIQLFYTMISNKNKSLRKFHRLNGSIIILDEVQSIPIKYWLFINNILTLLMEELNIYVIFITATEPLIFEKNKMVELVNREKYFKNMNRVSLIPLLKDDLSLEDLYKRFTLEESKKYLFIFNTIESAKKFYKLIENNYKSISFLSTHITPKERLERINSIRKGEFQIVVTTQLVEAGVDIDFDVVIRDIAPLDSINQASGRCNRNDTNNTGTVYVVSLKDENGKKYSCYIYDSVLLDITKKILNKYDKIEEQQFLELIDEYYKETLLKKSQSESRKLLEAIEKLRYDSDDKEKLSIADFKLIKEDYFKKDVFVEIDDEAAKVWKKYLNLKHIANRYEKKNAFDSLKANFYKFIISIPANTKNPPQEVGFIWYIKNDILKDYYDLKEIDGITSGTGFISKDDRSSLIW